MNTIPEEPSYRIMKYTDCGSCPKYPSLIALANKKDKKDPNDVLFLEHFPDGAPDIPKLMFVGEAPGAVEANLLRPFVGRSGKLFRKAFVSIVKELGFEDPGFRVLVTNTVKCRCIGPPDIEVVKRCAGALAKEADIFAPHLIIALGKTAFHALSGKGHEHFLGENRNNDFEFRGFPVRITYHPAAASRHVNYKILLYKDLKRYLRELKDGKQDPSKTR